MGQPAPTAPAPCLARLLPGLAPPPGAHQVVDDVGGALMGHKLHRHQVERGVRQAGGLHVGVQVLDALPLPAGGRQAGERGALREPSAIGRGQCTPGRTAIRGHRCPALPHPGSPGAARQLPLPQLRHRQEVGRQVQARHLQPAPAAPPEVPGQGGWHGTKEDAQLRRRRGRRCPGQPPGTVPRGQQVPGAAVTARPGPLAPPARLGSPRPASGWRGPPSSQCR